MNTESLERLLREKVPTDQPRPGFETRLQALAREPALARKRSYRGLLGLGLGFAALTLTVLTLSDSNRKPSPSIAEIPPPRTSAPLPSDGNGLALFGQAPRAESPVSKEIADLKKDARSAFTFLSDSVPSMPVK